MSVCVILDGNPGTRAPGQRSPGPWSQGNFLFLFLFFLAGVHFFQGLDEVDFFDESLSSLSRLGWVIFKSLETRMSHFQVSQDSDESLSSLSRLRWVTFKSLKTWMSHFQVSQDLDEVWRWRCSSEDPYTPGLWQVCYSSGQARGTLLHPPSALPLGSPGDGVSK